MYSSTELILLALLMMVVTIVPRVAPVTINYHRLPRWFGELLQYSPPCLIGALVANPVLQSGAPLGVSMVTLIAVIASAITAYFSNNLAATVVVGMVVHAFATSGITSV